MAADRFDHDIYLLKRKPLVLLGGVYTVLDPFGEVALHVWQEPLKLRAALHAYAAVDRLRELLTIQARQIVDFSAAYDLMEAPSGQRIGALRRRGWQSMTRDTWEILGPSEEPLAIVEEDTPQLAMARRFVTNWIPQKFYARSHALGGGIVAEYAQNFNPFYFKMVADFSMDHRRVLDRRLGLAAGLLLCAIERRQRTY